MDMSEWGGVLYEVTQGEVFGIGGLGPVTNKPILVTFRIHGDQMIREDTSVKRQRQPRITTNIETGPIHMTGLSGESTKCSFHLAAKSGPICLSSSSVGRSLTPASSALWWHNSLAPILKSSLFTRSRLTCATSNPSRLYSIAQTTLKIVKSQNKARHLT